MSEDRSIAEAGAILREEILRLDGLARSFSQLGRPVEGPPAPVDLTELVSSLARTLSTDAAPIALDAPDHPVRVQGYLEPLQRVVRNLLANAQEAVAESVSRGVARGGEMGPWVELVLRPIETGAEIRVLDRGLGIPEQAIERIWEPEFTTKRWGTGLGLPLVRQAVRAHGGEIWATRRPGGGSEFVVRLPSGG
jgi:signal transduction histidine kinase